MDEIGNLFALTRQNAGISIKEVSDDLNIDETMLMNIEQGKIGAFSDVFVLKEYIYNYAKYLGLDTEKIIDSFNEHIFTTTSKIPIKTIVKEMANKEKSEDKEEIASPYTKKESKVSNGLFLIICILVITSLIIGIFWSIKTITINSRSADSISYRK